MVQKKWDLIVVGAGLTGIAAAVSARRQGLDVLLIEKAGYLGGAPATMLINPFMPYSTNINGEKVALSRGFFAELQQILHDTGCYDGKTRHELHEEYIKLAMDRLIVREGVQPLLHACLCGVETEGRSVKFVKVATKRGVLTFEADYFIDCSGDADLAMLAGCPFRVGREEDGLCQPMTLCFRIGNIDIPTFEKNKAMMQALYKQFQQEGKIKNPREDVLVFHTHVDGMLHFNTTRIIKLDPTDPFDVTDAEMMAREQMFELYHFLRDNIPGCEKCQLLYSAGEIGVRESRMIDGDYVLNQNDLINCVKFDDRIAAGNYDIDIHNPAGSGTSHYYFKPGTWYTIPYRALLPRNMDNLLVAGRCISATHEAQASIRILPIVATLGHAAGIAAALASKSCVSVRDIRIKDLQDIIESEGGFIG